MGIQGNEEYILKELPKAQRKKRRNYILVLKILFIILVFFVGFVIGYFAMVDHTNKRHDRSKDESTNFGKFHRRLLNSLSAKSIETFSRFISKRPHIGGSNESEKLADYIINKWGSYGFDTVEKVRYDVLLSLPRKDKPNAVKLLSPSGSVLVDVQGLEKLAEPSENDTRVTPPFLAYSPAGDVTGTLIYVNYGTTEDFKRLASMGENCTGKIAIMRYGKIFRGDKVKHAQDCGAIGVLLYCDPADFVRGDLNNTYPKSWWLPPTATQRGGVMNVYGDPLTRGLPSIPGVYRIDLNKTEGIPDIPAQPMAYGDAIKFLSRMQGRVAPSDWQGGLPITYRIGPGFNVSGMKVRLEVNNEYVVKPIYNVIGSVVGREEPDRMVLVGSHRDAWVFGGVDATSAVSVKMEISRAIGELLSNTDWRPRRTIVFCSWGAEEFGLLGSTEWVEDNIKLLNDRAVAYFNTDSSVRGNYSYKAQGSPLLTELAYNESKLVPDPTTSDSESSLYDIWNKKFPSPSRKPRFSSLGSASDYAAFYQFAGVPSLDGRYEFRSMNVTMLPLYHTVHDTFYLQKHFNDPNFEIHLSMARMGARMLLSTADQPVLPFSVRYYAIALERSLRLLVKHYKAQLDTKNITLSYLQKAIGKFTISVDKFEKRKASLEETAGFAKLRMINDQMMQLERVFVYPYGLPGRPHIRHLIFAPMRNNAYGSAIFPGITDVLCDIRDTNNWDEVKKQVSLVTHSIIAASRLLEPLTKM